MALAELVSRLEREADARLTAARAAALARAAQLDAEATAARTEARLAELERRRQLRHAASSVELARTRQRAQVAVLEARWRLLDRVLARARELVAETAASPGYPEALRRQVRAALAYTGPDARVRCDPSRAGALALALDGQAQVVADAAVHDGAVVEADHGRVLIDVTLAGRLERSFPRLAASLVAEEGER